MPSLRFSASDVSVVVIGAIFRAADNTSPQTALQFVRVINGVSDPFTVSAPDSYRYEFNIHGSAKFTLSLATDPAGTAVTCFAGPFDPADPTMGQSGSIDRKSFFSV